MIKIFLEDGDPASTTWAPLYEGVVSNDRVMMVNSMDDADYCIFHFQGPSWKYFQRSEDWPDPTLWEMGYPNASSIPLEKTIYVDCNDSTELMHDHKVKLYLKRSMVSLLGKDGTRIKREYPEYVKPFSHTCVLNDLKNQTSSFNKDRQYDVISTFREFDGPLHAASSARGSASDFHADSNRFRIQLQNVLKTAFPFYCTSFKEFNDSGSGDFETSYINHLKNSKIIVTMNPADWEGDNRLYESLACGAMVFCDQLYVDIPDKFIDGKHLIYYNVVDVDTLCEQILYYLEHQDELNKIARAGYEFVHQFHSPSARIDQILNYLGI